MAYPARSDFRMPGPTDAWFRARSAAGPRVYAMAGNTFNRGVAMGLRAAIGTDTFTDRDTGLQGAIAGNAIPVDGVWDLEIQSGIIELARRRGLSDATLTVLRADRAAQTVGRYSAQMGAWVVAGLGVELASVEIPSDAILPAWGFQTLQPDGDTFAGSITVLDPTGGVAVVHVGGTGDGTGGTGAPVPRPAPDRTGWYLAAVAVVVVGVAMAGGKSA